MTSESRALKQLHQQQLLATDEEAVGHAQLLQTVRLNAQHQCGEHSLLLTSSAVFCCSVPKLQLIVVQKELVCCRLAVTVPVLMPCRQSRQDLRHACLKACLCRFLLGLLGQKSFFPFCFSRFCFHCLCSESAQTDPHCPLPLLFPFAFT